MAVGSWSMEQEVHLKVISQFGKSQPRIAVIGKQIFTIEIDMWICIPLGAIGKGLGINEDQSHLFGVSDAAIFRKM